MDPDIDLVAPTGESRQTRLLILYSGIDRAAALAQRLQYGAGELILSPLSVPIDGWLAELQPDAIFLSPQDGASELLAVCEAIRSRTDLPLVVLAPRTDDLVVARVLGLGVDEYLTEPIGDRELAARLDALLRRRRYHGPGEAMRVGDLVLCSLDHTVERRGRKVGLSPIEFRLLSCLVSAAGTVLTHQTLMARVWGVEYVDSRHYLRLYIRYLREKLEVDATNPKLILSEWGVGYRFQPQSPAPSTRPAGSNVRAV